MFVCFPFPFCWALVSYLFVFACLSLFRNFAFLIYFHVFEHVSVLFSFLNVFPSVAPFFMYLFFLFEDSVWFHHRFSHLFYFLLLHIFLFHTKPCFLNCFRLYCLSFLFLKNLCFLFVGPFKSENCSFVFSLSCCFSDHKTCIFRCFTFFFERFHFFLKKKSVGKTLCSCLSVSFQFFFHLFFVSFFVWCFSISFATCFPFKVSSLPLYFLFWFILFPSFLSLFCLLLFSRFFLFSLIKLPFLLYLLSPCFFMSNSLCNKKGYLFKLLQKMSFSVFSFQSKKLRFLCFLFCQFFQKFSFFHVWFFCVLKNDFSFSISFFFFASSFELSFSFLLSFLSWCIQK